MSTRSILNLLALGVAIGMVYQRMHERVAHRSVAAQAAIADVTTTGPCEGKQKCVVVYVAPWCSVCKASSPSILKLAAQWNAVGASDEKGLRILVGQSTPEKCAAYAEQLGVSAAVDPGNSFSEKNGINAYPTWVVFDSTGKELNRISAGIPSPDMTDAFVKQALRL